MLKARDPRAGSAAPLAAVHRERRQPGLPGAVRSRRARQDRRHVGHRRRRQAAQVSAHVPRGARAGADQDRSAAAPGLRRRCLRRQRAPDQSAAAGLPGLGQERRRAARRSPTGWARKSGARVDHARRGRARRRRRRRSATPEDSELRRESERIAQLIEDLGRARGRAGSPAGRGAGPPPDSSLRRGVAAADAASSPPSRSTRRRARGCAPTRWCRACSCCTICTPMPTPPPSTIPARIRRTVASIGPGARSISARRRAIRQAGRPGMNALAALADLTRAPGEPVAPAESRCQLCALEIDAGPHAHVVDLERRSLLCACAACAALVEQARATARPRRRSLSAGADARAGRPGVRARPRAVGRAADPGAAGVHLLQLARQSLGRVLSQPGRRRRVGAVAGRISSAGGARAADRRDRARRRSAAGARPHRRRVRGLRGVDRDLLPPGRARCACTGRASTAATAPGARSTPSSPACARRRDRSAPEARA